MQNTLYSADKIKNTEVYQRVDITLSPRLLQLALSCSMSLQIFIVLYYSNICKYSLKPCMYTYMYIIMLAYVSVHVHPNVYLFLCLFICDTYCATHPLRTQG